MAHSTTAGQGHDRISPGVPGPTINEGIADATESTETVPNIEITLGQKMLSAVSGSIFTSLLVTPLDVVRVRLQSQQHSPSSSDSRNFPRASIRSFTNLPSNMGVTACCREVFWVSNNARLCTVASAMPEVSGQAASAETCAAEESQKRAITSTFDGMRKIARNEGLTTLWRGLSPTLLMAVPGNVIYFAGYDWLRTSQYSPIAGRVSDVYAPLVAGSSARVFAALFVSPIELFRTRMQASQSASAAGTFRDTLSGVREMASNQGVHTLWRGLTLTLWRDVPFSALYWWGYEAGRNVLIDFRTRMNGGGRGEGGAIAGRRSGSRNRQNHTSTLIDSFIAGAASGAVASVVTTPFDVGKTRQQVFEQAGDSAPSKSKASTNSIGALRPEDRSMPRLLLHIFQEEGAVGLFRGWAARCLKVAPACAIMISSYELGKKMAQNYQKDAEET
ncbi:MAG: hypothetical protein M1828_004768 [Chrysothrix sp. TS-e1954]|nr:MAG: hypothetical protein M1828_004768 [Chrysothrix sp. TS-e1954]